MATDGNPPRPTEAELSILRVLWDRGPSTVREVHEAVGTGDGVRYTTRLKQLQVMTSKRLVRRDATRRSHVYSAAVDEDSTQRSLLRGFVDRVFRGSVDSMLIHALRERDLSPEQLAEIERLLEATGGER